MKKVFIAEDAPDIARVYQYAFQKSGYSVEIAPDGARALEALFSPAHAAPDAILLDIMVPKATGFEVLAGIKKENSVLRHVPVLAMTNLVSLANAEADMQKIRALGARDVIIKSQTDPQDVVRMVDALFVNP